MSLRTTATSLALFLLLPLAACGSSRSDGTSRPPNDEAAVQVEAAFYPLQWIAQQVGGDDVAVTSLTPPGAEPHDLELTPKQVARIGDADLVVKLSGLQPAVDDATASSNHVFDAADVVDLDLTTAAEHEHADGDDHAAEAEDGHDDEQVRDPHFWLDPTMLAQVAPALADRFAELDPDHADDFHRRADATVAVLDGIDRDFAKGLASCRSTDLVTSHEAFGYLARRYGFTQIGINGLSAEQEPSPGRLAEVTDFVEDHDVTTIYFETLVPSDIAKTIAEETGAETAVLDPIEGLTDESAGDDYPSVMAANLEALRRGQDCS